MGVIDVKLTVVSLDDKKKTYTGKFLVDTGAKYTVLPEKVWKPLGLKPHRTQEFSLADGSTMKRAIGGAYIRLDGREAPTPVVLGKKKDSPLLGVVTLEAMGLAISPFTREIHPDKLMIL